MINKWPHKNETQACPNHIVLWLTQDSMVALYQYILILELIPIATKEMPFSLFVCVSFLLNLTTLQWYHKTLLSIICMCYAWSLDCAKFGSELCRTILGLSAQSADCTRWSAQSMNEGRSLDRPCHAIILLYCEQVIHWSRTYSTQGTSLKLDVQE